MGFARAAGVPVLLLGDIDRGGVIAQMVGTLAVLDPEDAAMIRGFAINKFRGDPRLFDDGYAEIAARTGWRGYGVLPWFEDARRLPAEDALDVAPGVRGGRFKVACLLLSRIANFDDLDPLKLEPGVSVAMIRPGEALPGDADLVVLPGTKSTRGDLDFLRRQGWDIDIAAHVRRGGAVLGLCGGYQMLGRAIEDPDGIEGPARFHAHDARLGQRGGAHEDQRVLLGVDVVGDGADVVAVAEGLAQLLHQRRLAGADRAADTDAQGAVGGLGHGEPSKRITRKPAPRARQSGP
jgi:cobyric acid synthase